MATVTSIDKPRCSWCGKFKPASDLNGVDPLATGSEKYKHAYCRRLEDCDSEKANEKMNKIVSLINTTD